MDYETDNLHHSLGEHYQAPEDSTPHWHTLVAHMEDASRSINTALINGHKVEDYFQGDGPANTAHREYHHALHAAVDHVMAHGGAPFPFKVYSGVNSNHSHKLASMKTGDTAHFPAWTSTSLEPNVAYKFAHGDGHENRQHVCVFHIPQGFRHGAYIAHTTPAWSDEREFLMKPDTRWRKTHSHNIIDEGDAITLHHFEPVHESA